MLAIRAAPAFIQSGHEETLKLILQGYQYLLPFKHYDTIILKNDLWQMKFSRKNSNGNKESAIKNKGYITCDSFSFLTALLP